MNAVKEDGREVTRRCADRGPPWPQDDRRSTKRRRNRCSRPTASRCRPDGLVSSAAEAVELAETLGGPVVMKAVGALIQHKTESRLVVLDLRSAAEVAAAVRGARRTGRRRARGRARRADGPGSREFMVGMKRDPAFGPVVVFGVGGIFTEAHDIALGVPPVDEGDRGHARAHQGTRCSTTSAACRAWTATAGRRHPRARAHRRGPSGRDRDRREPAHRGRRDAGGRRRARDPRSRGARSATRRRRRAHLAARSDPAVRAARRRRRRRLERPSQMGRLPPAQPHRRRLRRRHLPRERSWRHRVRSARLREHRASCRKPRTWRWWRWGPPT